VPLHEQDFPGALSPVAIFGPGLIGGSLAMALGRLSSAPEIRVFARNPGRAAAALGESVFCSSDPCEVARGASVVVFCTPVECMGSLARAIRDIPGPDAVVTDAGSVKEGPVRELEEIFGGRYVGAHPMAGSEQAGIEAARKDLFDGACCILTPTDVTATDALARVEKFWTGVGCRTLCLSASEHDRLVALASHLPHAVASILIETVGAEDPLALQLAGGGLRDSTRIAAGPPEMWAGIFHANRGRVVDALDQFLERAARFRGLVSQARPEEIAAFLASAKNWRDSL